MKDKKNSGGILADFYIQVGTCKLNAAHQFKKTHSIIYDCDEYVWMGNLTKGKKISFHHGDGRSLPDAACYNQISGPGVTFTGIEACSDLRYEHALVCPVDGQDLIYNFIDSESFLTYVGKTGVHSLFIRIYDNNSGVENDRWLVIAME